MNDFSTDPNCVALWNLESGVLTVDSKGSNTLSSSIDEDTVNYKQGLCSGLWVRANGDRMWMADADLDSGFPGKDGESNKNFSIPVWVRFNSKDVNQWLTQKGASGSYCWNFYLNTSNQVRLAISSNGTSWTNVLIHDSVLDTGRWYHITVTYDNSDYSARIRIWDDTAHVIVGTDKTGTMGDLFISAGTLFLGYPSASSTLDGNMDEIVVLNDVLTVDEIDQIRAGTYGGAPPPVTNRLYLMGRPPGCYATKRCIVERYACI